jgi:hypothetical protein
LSSGSASPPLLLLIALACLGGAGALAWFSSPVTMTLTRTKGGLAVVSFESRLFGLYPRSSDRIENVKSVSTITFRGPGSRSDTPDRIVFETPSGPVDRGMVQQQFVRDFAEIKTFFGGDNEASSEGGGETSLERDVRPGTLSLSSIGRGSEARRFAFAQLAAAFLMFLGLGVGWMGAKALAS